MSEAKKEKNPILIISHGDKGGSGKSFVADLLGSEALRKGKSVLIVEADAGAGGQDDVGRRFYGLPNASFIIAALRQKGVEPLDSIQQMFGACLNKKADVVIINTPAGASDVFEGFENIIPVAAKNIGFDLKISYTFTSSDTSIENAERMLKSPLIQNAKDYLFIFNKKDGDVDFAGTTLEKVNFFKLEKIDGQGVIKAKQTANDGKEASFYGFMEAMKKNPLVYCAYQPYVEAWLPKNQKIFELLD